MAIKDTIRKMENLLEEISCDLEKAQRGNNAAAQRVRTGTIRLEKIAKLYRKESVKHAKSSAGKKKTATKRKTTAKKAAPKRKAAPKKKTATRKAAPKRKTAAKKTAPKRKTATKKRVVKKAVRKPAKRKTTRRR